MANYCVIRTDLMSGTNQPADIVSLRFYGADGNPAEVENGVIVKLQGYEDGQREVMKAVAASSTDSLNNCAIVAGVEVMYDERKKNLNEFVNESGKAIRGYIPRSRNEFSVTKEGFVNATPPAAVGAKVGIGANGKISATVAASATELGEVIAIETAGRYTYYVIRISPTEG